MDDHEGLATWQTFMHVYAKLLLQMMQELWAQILLFIVGLMDVKHFGYATIFDFMINYH